MADPCYAKYIFVFEIIFCKYLQLKSDRSTHMLGADFNLTEVAEKQSCWKGNSGSKLLSALAVGQKAHSNIGSFPKRTLKPQVFMQIDSIEEKHHLCTRPSYCKIDYRLK